MPRPAVVAQGVSSANSAHRFRDFAWDFATMRQVFNAVALLPGNPAAVVAAHRAGLAVVLEFDAKSDYFAGRSIEATVREVGNQIRAQPGMIVAVDVADRLNEKYSAAQGLRYLAATGGLLHRLVPGLPVLVNASDWQLTCDLPGQSSCAGETDPRFRYETDATLTTFYRSGFVDGLLIANNLKNLDASAQATAWRRARTLWPRPFLLWTTSSQLSFPANSYAGNPPANAAVAAYLSTPLADGADGAALWAWHQLYAGQVYTFLDKNGTANAVWAALRRAAPR